jgi:hypothetical protein
MKKIRYNFKRDHRPGEYAGFEVRLCYQDDDWGVSNIMDDDHLEFHREEGTQLFWGVYTVNPDGTSDHLGDFTEKLDALKTVRKLGGHLCSSW